jgi:hypothetical protein
MERNKHIMESDRELMQFYRKQQASMTKKEVLLVIQEKILICIHDDCDFISLHDKLIHVYMYISGMLDDVA